MNSDVKYTHNIVVFVQNIFYKLKSLNFQITSNVFRGNGKNCLALNFTSEGETTRKYVGLLPFVSAHKSLFVFNFSHGFRAVSVSPTAMAAILS